MAGNRIKGITIEIGGDTTKLDKALSGTNNQLKDTQAKLKDVERLLKLDPGNVELLDQKQRLLAQSVDATSEKLKTLKQVAEESTVSNVKYEQWTKSFASLQGQITKTSTALAEVEKEGAKLADLGFAPDSEPMVEAREKAEALRKKLGDLNQKVTDTYEELGRPISIDQWDALQREMSETAQQSKRAEKSLDDLEDQLKDVGRAADNVGDDLDELGDASNDTGGGFNFANEAAIGFARGLGELLLKAIVETVKWMWNMDEATEELREGMGKLDTAFQVAGYSAETAREAYQGFYNILGDTDTAVEASQLLAKLANGEEELSRWTDIAAGVYGTFGDSLPIEGLIEAANETAKVGKVTGNLADALNWAEISEDQFNKLLEQNADSGTRSRLIMDTLTRTYKDAADAFYENNEALIKNRESQSSLNDASIELGQSVADVKAAIDEAFGPSTEFLLKMAADAFNKLLKPISAVGDAVEWLMNAIRDTANAFRKLFGVKGQLDEHWNVVQNPGGIPAEPFFPQSMFSMPTASAENLPHLARGTVTRPNSPFLAVVGDNPQEPEIVAPLSTIKQAVREANAASGGRSGPIQVTLTVNGPLAPLVRMMNPQIKAENQRLGPELVT